MSTQYMVYSNQNSVLGILAGLGTGMMLFSLILMVLTIIALWKIFTKAGEEGWKSLIPIYNTYILFKISGRSFGKFFLLVIGANIASSIAVSIGGGFFATILSLVGFALAIWVIVEAILCYHGLSTSFGHGAGFTVGLILLNTIFMMILGFGSDQYQGNSNM